MIPDIIETPRDRLFRELREIADRHGVPFADMLSPAKSDALVNARAECFYHAWTQGYSRPHIGRIFNRDCTTVAYAIGKHMIMHELGENWMTRNFRRRRRLYAPRPCKSTQRYKLTLAQVREIWAATREPYFGINVDLARKYGVTAASISSIRHKRTYPYVAH